MTSDPTYARRIAALHDELGIASSYALTRQLEIQNEAPALESVGRADAGRECLLSPPAARAWREMGHRAREYDLELIPLSGFRSLERQAEIIRGKLALGESIDRILNTIAAPGYSEHHTGNAIDIGAPGVLPLEEAFADTRAFSWLERHAGTFGFVLSFPRGNRHGLIYEPWHWCWRG